MIEEKIENQPLGDEENKPKTEKVADPSLIEIDGSVETSEKAKPLSAQAKKNKLKEMKAKKEAEYKAKQKEEKLRLKELQKLEKSQNTSSRKISFKPIIIVLCFILLGGGFAFVYFKKPELLKNLIPGKQKETVVLVNSDSTVASETPKADTASNQPEVQTSEVPQSNQDESQVSKPEPKPEQVSMPKEKTVAKNKSAKKESKSEPLAGRKTTLNGPCWIVSFSSVKDEKVASKGVKKLVDKGFLGGYYWMPDVDPNAKQLYKVYSGPYTSEAEARAKQRDIAAFNEDAYVMKLNK